LGGFGATSQVEVRRKRLVKEPLRAHLATLLVTTVPSGPERAEYEWAKELPSLVVQVVVEGHTHPADKRAHTGGARGERFAGEHAR
jgi:hypothetical protein